MVGDKRADRAVVMGHSSRMVMKCKSQNTKRKANKQKMDKFPIHYPINLPKDIEKQMGPTLYFFKKDTVLLSGNIWEGCTSDT
jgi:hypothetical protein